MGFEAEFSANSFLNLKRRCHACYVLFESHSGTHCHAQNSSHACMNSGCNYSGKLAATSWHRWPSKQTINGQFCRNHNIPTLAMINEIISGCRWARGFTKWSSINICCMASQFSPAATFMAMPKNAVLFYRCQNWLVIVQTLHLLKATQHTPIVRAQVWCNCKSPDVRACWWTRVCLLNSRLLW